MTKTEHYQTKLHEELEQVTNELKTIATQDPNTKDWVAVPDPEEEGGDADDNIEADAVEDWNERCALVAQLEIRYRNITLALEKIAGGTYGICEISGEPIEPERLEVNPAARTNIANRERERELSL